MSISDIQTVFPRAEAEIKCPRWAAVFSWESEVGNGHPQLWYISREGRIRCQRSLATGRMWQKSPESERSMEVEDGRGKDLYFYLQ